MDINSSYTGLQGINHLQPASSLERIASGLAINKASDDASGLTIATNLGVAKNSISQSLENMNSGIAMTNIAQQGLSSQKEILENIKIETLKAMNGTMNENDREIIAQRIEKYIEQYDNVANQTKYNDMNLLKTDGTSNDDISIATSDSIINVEKSDTLGVSDGLKSLMQDFTTNPESMKKMLTSIGAGLNTLSDYAADFGSASNMMQSAARGAITTEKELAQARSTILDIDYSKEVSNFSKTNIMTQIGLIMQTQANAIQSKNIALLS
jgi:flagellin